MPLSLTALSYALCASVIPAIVWLVFWLREDTLHPEPRWLIAASFLGGVLAVAFAIVAEKYVAVLVSDQAPKILAWLSNQNLRYTIWAAIEEIVKIVAVAIVALNSRYNDEPIDAMIYCVTVALGFAALENTLFILGPLSQGSISQSIETGSMRFIGATLVHTVSTALIGFALGYAFYRGLATKIFLILVGLVAAIGVHAAFNISITSGASANILNTFIWIWAAVVILIILFEEIKAVKPRTKAIFTPK